MRDRHCEAAKPPKPSRLAGPRVMSGRRILWPRPILDCFVLASLGLAMTAGAGRARGTRAPPCPPSLPRRVRPSMMRPGLAVGVPIGPCVPWRERRRAVDGYGHGEPFNRD